LPIRPLRGYRLELRFASSGLMEPPTVARIAYSIERCGQFVPCAITPAHLRM
jgi:hypothetical protein